MDLETKQLEERSDYLNSEEVKDWYVDNDFYRNIQKKLLGPGAKLLVGPRGTGKTHQMLYTYNLCIEDDNKPMALYISFNRYYHLEPLISSAPNAKNIFHTWVLAKIILSLYEFCHRRNIQIDHLISEDWLHYDYITDFIGEAEKSNYQFFNEEILYKLNVSFVKSLITNIQNINSRKRTIILLDDAALTLTPEYLVEFFEIFVSLKSNNISPKASVYPGTTDYGMKFHLGHDAEKVDCWINVSEDMDSYSKFMDDLINKRFSFIKESIDTNILELLKYASFGIPRAFIFLIRSYLQSSKNTKQAKFNEVIDIHSELIKAEYRSLKQKVPQFENIIEVGYEFFQNVIGELTSVNKNIKSKNLILGLEKYDNRMIDRMLQLLIEAGLLYKYSSNVHHGLNREYIRFTPHLIFLFKMNAFSEGKGFDANKILNRLLSSSEKHPMRRKFEKLVSSNSILNLKLDLPTCNKCRTPRMQESQRFCHVCGNELVNPSAFQKCMDLSVDVIPFTPFLSKAVKDANFKKIRDFYAMQNPTSELIKIRRIGNARSQEIIKRVKIVVEEFLA